MKLTTKSKRLGVFIFFDRDSIIDDYVLYMLDSLNKAVNNILFISNSKLSKKELSKLDIYNIEISIRENKGLDAGAFKYTYDKYGRNYFLQYDEVILLNDTFFGPFKPFKEIINSMNDKDLDFWGLTANYDSEDGTGKAIDGYIHSHIQTYFVAYRKSVLASDFFDDYWKKYKIENNNSFVDVVNNHESYFTYRLEKAGFKWGTYIDLSHYINNDYKYNYNIYGYSSYTLLNNFNCPFIKRKNLVFNKQEALYMNNGLDTSKSLEWIKNNTNYDVNMIYKNIVRLYDPVDIYQSLNMNYFINESTSISKHKMLLICNIEDEKALQTVYDRISKLDNITTKYITNNMDLSGKYEFVEKLSEYVNKNKKYINTYDYVCLLNLSWNKDNFAEVSDSNNIRTIDNLLSSKEYINGIMNVFDEEERIGVLYSPESYHNKYIMNITGRNLKENKNKTNIYEKDSEYKSVYKSFDGLWIKSSLLSECKITYYDIQSFISISEVVAKENSLLVAKVYNKNYAANDLLSMEKIYNSYVNSDKLELSYPNKMIILNRTSLLRRIFRAIVPFGIRAKLKKIFKI